MRSGLLSIPLAVVLALPSWGASDIDATGLSTPVFQIGNPSGTTIYSSTSVQSVALAAGPYYFFDVSSQGFPFDVDGSGNFNYAASLEPFVHGAGTSTLTVVGFDFTVDATQLSTNQVYLHLSAHPVPNTGALSFTGIPATYAFFDVHANPILFQLDGSGLIRYTPSYESFLDGAGTTALTVRGFDFILDATPLTSEHVSTLDITWANTTPRSLTGIPGSYAVIDQSANQVSFQLGFDGLISYLSVHENFFSGVGTTTITVDGFHVDIDARSMASLSSIFWIGGLQDFPCSSASVQCLTGIPGSSYGIFDSGFSNLLTYSLGFDGNLANLAPTFLGFPVTGNGTTNLLIGLNSAPVANAGMNIAIIGQEQSITTIVGTTTDEECDYLAYRWVEETPGGDVVLAGPSTVLNGMAPLALNSLPPLSIGSHTLRLEVSDPYGVASDTIVLTVGNSPPVVAAGGSGAYPLGPTSNILLSGQIADYDGNFVGYEWREGTAVLFAGGIAPPFGGASIAIPGEVLATTTLGLGTHFLDLVANDGMNQVQATIQVDVTGLMDQTAPQLAPVATPMILWPPNHKMVRVTVQANATDNSGSVTLSVVVTSSEPPDFDGDGHTIPDFEVVSVNSLTGVIELDLRAERRGKGAGRTYTVSITATDAANNSSTGSMEIKAPHDRGR